MEQTAELIPSYFAKIARIAKGELLTHEEIELSRRAKAGDESARKRLIENNLSR
jgi:DNA-directed RNA polymerase sigma subunit (sigma70/sigma32)